MNEPNPYESPPSLPEESATEDGDSFAHQTLLMIGYGLAILAGIQILIVVTAVVIGSLLN